MQLFKGAAYLSLSLLLITSVSSMPNTTQYRLNSKLFDGYDQYIIPVIDTSTVLEVTALYSLSQVISIVSFYLYLKHRYLTAIFGHVQRKKYFMHYRRYIPKFCICNVLTNLKFRMTRQKTSK